MIDQTTRKGTTMERKEYNGWTNYETWVVALWMDNEQGSCDFWAEEAQDAYNHADADSTFTKLERATLTLATGIKEHHEENTPTVVGAYADLLNAALSEVDWHEIAAHLMENVDQDAE